MEPNHRTVLTNGINMHIAEQGEGPLVVMCHGFPESWYSWRHQLGPLADAGCHAVAPDMRGYGETDRPEPVDQYSVFHLVGDVVGLLDALGEETAVIAGHDWGATVAWTAALLRPDRFRGVIGLSVPTRARTPRLPSSFFPQSDDAVFYMQYFQEPGVAEAELERDPRDTMRRLLFSASADSLGGAWQHGSKTPGMLPRGGGMLTQAIAPETLPAWLSEDDVDYYAGRFRMSGYRGGLNWYRNIDRNWELTAAYAGARTPVPALYVVGNRDLVTTVRSMEQIVVDLQAVVPNLRRSVLLPGCGHWTQQEKPDEVNREIIDFVRGL
jgi:pimeloyl-ACP methyl ester carboxylesterase